MILKQGNLFDTNAKIIAHGVNCQGAFNSGVAGQIARLFPFVKTSYLAKHHGERWHLGDVQFVEFSTERIFANCATQQFYGRKGKFVDYEAVGTCMNKLIDYAESKCYSIAMPKIGCGLGGGDWDVVSKIIQEVLQERKVVIEVWDL
jgi:O-acetyl-ADP-ribose deacetylase (regulator of RNase III)